MERTLKDRKIARIPLEEEDPKGPMMVWDRPRSKEDIEFMSDWAINRRTELAKEEKARSAGKAE
jgi:hypothetical protein